jgi:two-component system cell cycle response regulator
MAPAGKILVVDDDAVVAREVSDILRQAGYDIVNGSNGHEALTLLREAKPDPVILVTARDDVYDKVESLEMGADDYLVKPLNRMELSARVKNMMKLKVLQNDLMAANDKLRQVNERLQELSMTDPLTGICNRLYFQKRISYEFQRSARYRTYLALLMLDLDHFKRINDAFGHPYGDFVLKHTAQLLTGSIRAVDILARFGGEEIIIACPETNLKQALIVAERCRSTIEKNEYKSEGIHAHVTTSIGIAVFPDKRIRDVEGLLAKADEALYAAKNAGRNCIRCASEPEDE